MLSHYRAVSKLMMFLLFFVAYLSYAVAEANRVETTIDSTAIKQSEELSNTTTVDSNESINQTTSSNEIDDNGVNNTLEETKSNSIFAFIRVNNSALTSNGSTVSLRFIINTYLAEAKMEGINSDIIIAHVVYNTNFLRNETMLSKNNPGGIGSTNIDKWELMQFTTLEEGIRAHVQHIKGYASTKPLINAVVDPRYNILREKGLLGKVNNLNQLVSGWYTGTIDEKSPPSRTYYTINGILHEMYTYKTSN